VAIVTDTSEELVTLPSRCKKFKLFVEYSEAATLIIICQLRRHHVPEDVIQATCKMS